MKLNFVVYLFFQLEIVSQTVAHTKKPIEFIATATYMLQRTIHKCLNNPL